MNKEEKKGVFLLIATAFIWGFSLVAQQAGMESMGPWSFTAVRCTLGAFSMIPLIVILEKNKKNENQGYDSLSDTKELLLPGIICGFVLLLVTISQQYGLLYTGVGKGAFITDFYIFLTPVFGLFLGKKVSKKTWISVALAMTGLYFITMSSGFGNINKGDLIMLLAAVAYAVYMHIADYFVSEKDAVKLAWVQFMTMGLFSFIPAFILEKGDITWEHCIGSLIPILYAGIISCVGGYTFQLLGQKRVEPAAASIILSLEAVFSVIAGWLILNERLSVYEYTGCLIMMAAIILSVIPEGKKG